MNTRRMRWMMAALLLVLGAGVPLSADKVKLKSGKVVEGLYMGGDSKAVRILLQSGQVSEIPLTEAVGVEFTPRKPPTPAPAPAPAAAPAAAPKPAAPKMATVPAGTGVNVRLAEAIDVDSSRAGMTFKAVVDDPVIVDGSTLIPRGASAVLEAIHVEQSGKMKGSDKVTLKLNAIGFGGFVYPVSSSYNQSKGKGEGKRTSRKVGGGAGLGAIVGGIAGGGEGAAIGAVVGGVTGAAVASQGEEHLQLPAETRLNFQLSAAVSVRR
jgi:hypothetical protein